MNRLYLIVGGLVLVVEQVGFRLIRLFADSWAESWLAALSINALSWLFLAVPHRCCCSRRVVFGWTFAARHRRRSSRAITRC